MGNRTGYFLGFMMFSVFAWSAHSGTTQEPAQESPMNPQIVVPEGTVIPVVLTAYLNTRSSQAGDIVYAETAYPIWIHQRLAIPRGSLIRGTVTQVVRPGRIKGKGRLAIRFDDILLPNGIKREFIASIRGIHGSGNETIDRNKESVSAEGSAGTDASVIAHTGSQGAIIGAITDRGRGAAIGAGVGATAGIITTLVTRGRDLVLAPGTHFDLELRKSLKFAYPELDFTDAQLDRSERLIQPRPVQASPREGPSRVPRIVPYGGIGVPIY